MASTYLSKTASSPNQKTFTISFWTKKSSNVATYQYIHSFYSDSNNRLSINWHDAGYLMVYGLNAGVQSMYFNTAAKSLDVNGWYHIVLKIDTTQATASDRATLYVNGEEITAFNNESYPNQNLDFAGVNATTYIGTYNTSLYFLDGLLAHYHYCDGYAYDASYFGETDSTSGVWKPKTAPSVTYGTNGYFLKFANSASLGTDSSGNTNDFTVNGSGTQTLDTPSNVYATFNPLAPSASQQTMQNGNLHLPGPNSNNWWQSVPATLGATKGKWYWEFKDENAWGTTSDSTRRYGICDLSTISNAYSGSTDVRFSDTTSAYAYMNASGVRYNGATISGTTSTYPTFSPTDIIQVAMDLDNYKLYFGKNGTWLDSSDPANGTNPVATLSSTAIWSPYAEIKYGSDNVTANFGNGYFKTTAISSPNSDSAGEGKFAYTVPTGYYALNTKNLKTYG